MTDEILTVDRYCRESDGDVCVKCAHCGWVIGLERGPFKGEQYRHAANAACGGWLEVAFDATRVQSSQDL